ncbi:hypothetical protein [Nocardia sp. NPDC051832]|uniref:hypothetical protein n=1 Tax=Nocardia sp. NPDC051832 TaxID=3155673 RepID=UPI00342F8A20
MHAASGDSADLENAFRAWAASEAQAARIQKRIDERRLAYAQNLYAETARTLARMLYSLMIGGSQLHPPLTPVQHREMYTLLGDLLQHDNAPERRTP